MDTYFASPERAHGGELAQDVSTATQNPIIDALLRAVGGLLAVLNEHRQILAINNSLLEMLGIPDAGSVLGLRPEEAIKCIHSSDMPGGCGTGKLCATCGAAIAIVSSLRDDKPAERDCVATVEKDGKLVDLYLRVRACPVPMDAHQYVLLFLHDATAHQLRAGLERAFFHDIAGIINGLVIATHLLGRDNTGASQEMIAHIKRMSSRLAKEVEIQRSLTRGEPDAYRLSAEDISVQELVDELRDTLHHHPAAQGKSLSISQAVPDLHLNTDRSLILRILLNMLTNAFEATDEGGEIRFWAEDSTDAVDFCVWTREAIPDSVALRIFQRNFSTKPEPGRGVGTYSMKLLGEHCLGGNVDFSTSDSEGTVFRLSLSR